MVKDEAVKRDDKARRPTLSTGKKVFFSTLILLAGLLLSEGMVRLSYCPPQIGIADELGNRYESHPYLGYTAEPVAMQYGGKPDDPCDADAVKIACMGGSTTRDEYPRLLRSALQDAGLPKNRVMVLDAACAGYTTMESQLLLLMYVLPLKPDYVVVMHAYNDVKVRMSANFQPDYTHYRLNPWRRLTRAQLWRKQFNILLDCSRLLMLIREMTSGYVTQSRILENYVCHEEVSEQILTDNFAASSSNPFETHMRNIQAACAGSGVRAVFVTQPLHPDFEKVALFLMKEGAQEWAKDSPAQQMTTKKAVVACHLEGQRQHNDVVRKLCKQYGIMLVDWAGQAATAGSDGLFVDQVHLTEEGNRALADMVGRKLLPLIRKRDKARGKSAAATGKAGQEG